MCSSLTPAASASAASVTSEKRPIFNKSSNWCRTVQHSTAADSLIDTIPTATLAGWLFREWIRHCFKVGPGTNANGSVWLIELATQARYLRSERHPFHSKNPFFNAYQETSCAASDLCTQPADISRWEQHGRKHVHCVWHLNLCLCECDYSWFTKEWIISSSRKLGLVANVSFPGWRQ